MRQTGNEKARLSPGPFGREKGVTPPERALYHEVAADIEKAPVGRPGLCANTEAVWASALLTDTEAARSNAMPEEWHAVAAGARGGGPGDREPGWR